MAKRIAVRGQQGSYAFLGEVKVSELQFGSVYMCELESQDDDGEIQMSVQVVKVVSSSLKDEPTDLLVKATIAGNEVNFKSTVPGGPKKQVWFMNELKNPQGYFLSQLPKCRFFGPLMCEISE